MILGQLIEKKDLKAYIHYRIKHLELEKQKQPFLNIEDKRKEVAIKKIEGRIIELKYLVSRIDRLKEASKYHCSKVEHLKKMKVAHIKGEFN